MSKNTPDVINDKNTFYLKIASFFFIVSLLSIYIIYLFDFAYNLNLFLYILLVSIMILPFIVSNDLMHPFNIFFITSQFLFVFNMMDISINKDDSFRYGSLPGSYHDTAFSWAIVVIITWYIFMYLGYTFSRKTKTSVITNSIFSIKNKKGIAFILIFLGIFSYISMVLVKGGFSGILESLEGRVEAYAGLTYLIKLTGLTTIGTIILLGIGYRKTSMVFIIISFFMLVSFGGRGGAFFGSIFPYLIFYHYQIKKVKVVKLIPLGLLTIIFSIGLAKYRLYQEVDINITGLYDMLSEIAIGTQGGEILPSLIGSLIQGNLDYKYGSMLINIFFAPIPSSLWPNKPQIDESGIVGNALMGSEYWGLPPGPYGISFFNFGFIGVIIIAFTVGFIIYKLYYKFVFKDLNNKIGQIYYTLIIASVFNFISTSAQINIIWYSFIFLSIKIIDVIISSFHIKRSY